MHHEITTNPISKEAFRSEFRQLLEVLRTLGHSECEVLFGWAWGHEYYPGKDWEYARWSWSDLEREVARVEAMGLGTLGNDDLFLKFGGAELTVCHESDLHLSFEPPNEIAELLYQRWARSGFRPREWECQSDGKRSPVLRQTPPVP